MKKIAIYILLSLQISIFAESIIPQFHIDIEDLITIVKDEPTNIKISILTKPNSFLKLIDELLTNNRVNLSHVNKYNRLSGDFIPLDMINLSDYPLHTRYNTMLFSKVALEDFLKMSKDADNQDIELFIASTYRSYEFQDKIFTNMKNYHGEEKAATIVAYPGASQHQLGTGVDFGSIKPSYAYTDAGIWLLENSWKYGFTISYPKGMEELTTYMWEPWHFRYIGHTGVKLQRNYFDDIQHLFLLFWHKYKGFFKERHIQ